MPTTIQDVPCQNRVLALTPDRAKRALYVDFEGEGKRSNGEIPQPTMLGILLHHNLVARVRIRNGRFETHDNQRAGMLVAPGLSL
jgi:hypothetical protein